MVVYKKRSRENLNQKRGRQILQEQDSKSEHGELHSIMKLEERVGAGENRGSPRKTKGHVQAQNL